MVFLSALANCTQGTQVFSLKSLALGSFCQFCELPIPLSHISIFVYACNHLDHRSDSPDAQDQVCVWVPRQVCALETIRPQTPCACVYKFHSGQENSSTNTKHLRHRANFYTLIKIICIGSGIQRICCVPNSLYLRSDRSLSSMKVDQCNTGHFKSSAPHKYSRNAQSHKYSRNTMSRLTSDCNALGKWTQIFFVHKIALATTLHQRPSLLTDFDTEYSTFLCVF